MISALISTRSPPRVDVSLDSADNYLLAMAAAAEADFLVTGDAKGLLRLKKFGGTRILAPGSFTGHFRLAVQPVRVRGARRLRAAA